MFEEMDEPAFPKFLAAFWAEKGWNTSVTANNDGTYLVAGDKDSGSRGLIGVRPSAETEIGASEVEDFAAFCDKKGVDVRVMATRGRFTTGARSAADAGNVHLLDPNELASAVRDEGVEELVGKFTGGGGGGGSLFDSLPFPVPSGLPSGVPVVPIAAAVVVVLAAVFAGPTLLGFVPFVGGGGGGGAADAGPPFTAMSLANSGNATANGTANVTTVQWDARVQDTVGNYSARPNETFVVVQFNATAGDEITTLRPGNFVLHVDGRNRAPQTFQNTTNAFKAKLLPTRIAPGETSSAAVVFSVPEDFDGATLVETYDGPGVRFERAELTFDVE
ncbi:restriction endonuclease [Halobacterium wangiae]|uniref:restriction endonuclease n=1 Tax=Halobacterium wangiae TaxID=2902623 RepID=UPI001E587FF0|nr:restriction endonuclease [Halobacterium wangiae]